MTVSKRSASCWPCVIGALTLLASPVVADAQQTAGAPRRAPAAPQATVAPPQAAEAPPAAARQAPAAQRAPAAPERRAVRRTSRPVRDTRAWYAPGNRYYGPYYPPTYFYGAQWGPYAYGPWGPHPFYGSYYYRERGSVRLQVKPEETEVYVDGYYAGVVDSFDGFFQRLSLPPGRHDIELRLEGYRSIQEQVYLGVGQTYRIEHVMEPLRPGETTPPPPTPRAEPEMPPDMGPDPFIEPDPFAEPATSFAPTAGFGRLLVRVQPADASIFVDGEEWHSPVGARLELEVGAGRRRIEVRREGYESYVTDVTVRSGESRTVNISLPRNRPEAPAVPAPDPGA